MDSTVTWNCFVPVFNFANFVIFLFQGWNLVIWVKLGKSWIPLLIKTLVAELLTDRTSSRSLPRGRMWRKNSRNLCHLPPSLISRATLCLHHQVGVPASLTLFYDFICIIAVDKTCYMHMIWYSITWFEYDLLLLAWTTNKLQKK